MTNRKFQFQLAQTNLPTFCNRCSGDISLPEHPEHIVLWPELGTPWQLHISCFDDILNGAIEFHETFVKNRSKKGHTH